MAREMILNKISSFVATYGGYPRVEKVFLHFIQALTCLRHDSAYDYLGSTACRRMAGFFKKALPISSEEISMIIHVPDLLPLISDAEAEEIFSFCSEALLSLRPPGGLEEFLLEKIETRKMESCFLLTHLYAEIATSLTGDRIEILPERPLKMSEIQQIICNYYHQNGFECRKLVESVFSVSREKIQTTVSFSYDGNSILVVTM